MEQELTKYTDELYYAALRMTGNADDAEEITQEAFLAAWQSLARGYAPENLRAWLYRILSNKHHDRLRRKYRCPTVSYDVWMTEDSFREPAETEEADETDGQLESIRREIGYLAATHREVFVRFYMKGETVETIAAGMGIPVGTVKSRLNKGRREIRKGVETMENYAKQSYAPEVLRIGCSGQTGRGNEPFSLVGYDDALVQNILIVAYEKPLTEVEIAKALGVPAGFIEPVVKCLINGELMARTDSGRVYSDFIQFKREDRYANFEDQLRCADTHYEEIRPDLAAAVAALRACEYYRRQDESCRRKLELHFCITLMKNAVVDVSETVAGSMPYEAYPYRKNGGRWIAMGSQYPAGYDYKSEAEYWKYNISGEFSTGLDGLYDTKTIELRGYSTQLGEVYDLHAKQEYVRWMYALFAGIETKTLGSGTLEAADMLISIGLLKKEGAIAVDIPVLTAEEYRAEKRLAYEMSKPVFAKLSVPLAEVMHRGLVKLPPHLKSVPKWQQYMYARGSVEMAILYHAIGDGILSLEENTKTPAVLLVIDR